MTTNLTKINENYSAEFFKERMPFNLSSSQLKNKSRRWKYTLPDLIKQCFICDNQIKVKYNLPKKRYSSKNNWGYWTQRENDKHKYLCNNCLMRLHRGSMSDWITDKDKAGDFYQYVYRGQFSKE